MRFFADEQLSRRQSLTPEGLLVITDTVIARCGDQTYLGFEVPVEPDEDGLVIVTREPGEVFSPASIASWNGKAITARHPDDAVTPDNFRELAIGHVMHARRGTGADSDCLVADLVITDPAAIRDIRSKRRLALSCGYDADYRQTAPGHGAQLTIRGNHVALLDADELARCGARCSIGDSVKPVTPAKQKARDTALRAMGVTRQQLELRHKHEQLRVQSTAVLRSINAVNKAYYHGR